MKTRSLILPAVLILFVLAGCRGTGGAPGSMARDEDPADFATRRLREEGQAREEEGDFRSALRSYRALVRDYPRSPLAPEAQFRIGVCLEEIDDLYAAFQAYQTLLEQYPGKGSLSEIVQRQYEIGEAYLQGRKRWFLFLRIRSGLSRAEEIFRTVVRNATFSPVSARAQYGLACSLQLRGDYPEAILEYEQVLLNYPGSEVYGPAIFGIGLCYYQESLRADYDQREVDEAIRHLGRFIRAFPDDPDRGRAEEMLGELRDRQAEKSYRIARYYEKNSSPQGARIYYREVAERYPESIYAAEARAKLEQLPED